MPHYACSDLEGLPRGPCHSLSAPGERKGRRELSGNSAGDPALPRQLRLREVNGLA